MRVLIYGAIGIVALVLQMGVVPYVMIDGQGPLLAVVPVVVVGLLYGPVEGAWAGAVVGALTDLMMGGLWGLATLLYMTVGYAAGRFSGTGRSGRTFLAFVGAGAAAAAVRAVGIVALRAGGGHVSVAALMPGLVFMGYTAVLGPIVLAIMDGRLHRRRRSNREA